MHLQGDIMEKRDKILIALLVIFSLILPTIAVVNNAASYHNSNDGTIKMTASIEEHGGFSPNELHLKLNQDNHLMILSNDVTHTFTVPDMNISVSLYPGHPVYLTIHPTTAGTFEFHCDAYCSPGHFGMKGTIIVQ